MSIISSDEIKGYLYGSHTDSPEPWQLENRSKAKIKLLKDIEDCNRELDKLPKSFKLYGHMDELDALSYAFRYYKAYIAP